MLTYHKQFERDFAEAGQVVIDATEGGLPKAHTLQMTLAAALAEHAGRPVPPLPVPDVTHDPNRLTAALEQVQRRLDEIQEIRRLSHATIPFVEQMIVHQRDFDRATALFDRIEKNRRRVETLNEAFSLVLELNTLGTFRRLRADRAIQGAGTDPYEVQRRQMERDLDNLRMLVQACDETTAIFADGVTRLKTLTKADVVCEQAA